MKPVYMSPRLSAYDNVLTDEELDYLWKNHNDMEFYWVSNVNYKDDNSHWTKVLTGPRSAKQEKDDITPLLAEADPTIHDLWQKFKIVGGERDLVRIYVNGYTYGTEGYVHKDNPRPPPEGYQWETILVYCNPRWNMQWGGETVFFEENKRDIFFASLPLPKRIVIFRGDMFHAGRGSSRACPVMRKTLACKTLKKVVDEPKCIELAKKLSQGEEHVGNVLFEHLFSVYTMLRKMGMPSEVRTAGLFHALYQRKKITEEQLVELIGEYGTDLLRTMKSTDEFTKHIISQPEEYGPVRNAHLAAMEYANITDIQNRTRLLHHDNPFKFNYADLRNIVSKFL